MKAVNSMRTVIDSRSVNESFARVAVSAFASQLDPTVEELSDIRTAVSEAVTNCIVHAYREKNGKIYINCDIYENSVIRIKIRDTGCGIDDVKQAMQPLFSTLGGERAGLGFAVMESFMDKIRVRSALDKGTTVTMEKKISGKFSDDC